MRRVTRAAYYMLFVPLGLVYRLVGRGNRELRIDRNAASYWSESRSYGDMRRPR